MSDVEEIERLAREQDIGISARSRALFTTFLLVVLGVSSVLRHMRPVDYVQYLLEVLFYVGMVGLLVFLGRRTLLRTRLNRQIFYMLGQTMVLLTCIRAVQVLITQPIHFSVAVEMLVCSMNIGALTWMLDRRLMFALPFYLAGAIAAVFLPDYVWLVNGAAHILTLGTLSAIWSQTPPSQLSEDV